MTEVWRAISGPGSTLWDGNGRSTFCGIWVPVAEELEKGTHARIRPLGELREGVRAGGLRVKSKVERRCVDCGGAARWPMRVRYGACVLELCRDCYDRYVRLMFPWAFGEAA